MATRRRGAPAARGADAPAGAPARFAFEHGTLRDAMRSRGESLPQFEYVGVLGGYRLHDHSIRQALATLFHWHNETVNVWVHVAGFIACAVLLLSLIHI